jgi:CheY-like chemotaxis protein
MSRNSAASIWLEGAKQLILMNYRVGLRLNHGVLRSECLRHQRGAAHLVAPFVVWTTDAREKMFLFLDGRFADALWGGVAWNENTELRLSGLNGAGAQWVLVVDDEVLIRNFVEFTLVEAGFDVLAVVPEEALATLNEQGATVRALITDIGTGSGISGWDIAAHARELHPQMPVVYLSGLSAGDLPVQGVPDSLMLQKPVTSAQVVAAVGGLLNKPHT